MDRARQFFSKIRGQVSGWIVTGGIIAITGFTPQEWAARLVRLFPAIETEWLSGLDLRLVLVALGTTIVVCSVLLQHRALRRLAKLDGRGSVTTAADRLSAALAGGETPMRVDRAEPGRAPIAPLLDNPSIAVLPFQNMSGDTEQEYFSDGITEDIITDLSKVSGLFVMDRLDRSRRGGRAGSPRSRWDGRWTGSTAEFPKLFAPDLPRERAEFVARSQVLAAAKVFSTPLTAAAWKTKPSWGIVAGSDKIINDLERVFRQDVPGSCRSCRVS